MGHLSWKAHLIKKVQTIKLRSCVSTICLQIHQNSPRSFLYQEPCANTEDMFFLLSIGHVHQLHYVTNEVILNTLGSIIITSKVVNINKTWV